MKSVRWEKSGTVQTVPTVPRAAPLVIRTCLDDCAYQVSSPYKVFNLVAVANMSEKNTFRFMGGVYTPLFGLPRKPPSTYLKNKTF